MGEDLFEDTNEKKSSEEADGIIGDKADKSSTDGEDAILPDQEDGGYGVDDNEAWIPLSDDTTDDPSSEKMTGDGIRAEAIDDQDSENITGEKNEIPHAEEEDVSRGPDPGDHETWIPPGDEAPGAFPSDDPPEEVSPEEKISREVPEDIPGEREKQVRINVDDDIKEYLGDEESPGFSDDMHEESDLPPWDEAVEVPGYNTTSPTRQKRVFVFLSIFAVLALAGAGGYLFFQSKGTIFKPHSEQVDKTQLFDTRKTEKIVISKSEAVPEKLTEKNPETERLQVKANSAPAIHGVPQTIARQGTTYRFVPVASDPDPDDKLTFFIANQPPWTRFDTATGILTGTPGSRDIGTYKNIVILVSDGSAIASLPTFSITVTGVSQVSSNAKTITEKKPAPVPAAKTREKPRPQSADVVGKTSRPSATAEKKKDMELVPYGLPDLTGLLKRSDFQDAARQYYQRVKQFPGAYSLKLEVDCMDKSVETAFRKGGFDRRMFILPKDIHGRNCLVVFWGLYPTKNKAIQALPTVPAFFRRQATKPALVLIRQYL